MDAKLHHEEPIRLHKTAPPPAHAYRHTQTDTNSEGSCTENRNHGTHQKKFKRVAQQVGRTCTWDFGIDDNWATACGRYRDAGCAVQGWQVLLTTTTTLNRTRPKVRSTSNSFFLHRLVRRSSVIIVQCCPSKSRRCGHLGMRLGMKEATRQSHIHATNHR